MTKIFNGRFLSVGDNGHGMKIKIYYNAPGEWPDVGRTVDSIKNGQWECVKLYNLDDFGVADLNFFMKYERDEHFNTGVDKKKADDIINLSMLCAETLFEILDKNNNVAFSYLYFEDEDYFLNTENYHVYNLTEEIKSISSQVIYRMKTDCNKKRKYEL